MQAKKSIKLPLTDAEKKQLRAHKLKIQDLSSQSAEDIAHLLQVPAARAMELHALIVFQSIPSLGIKFAQDMVDMGFRSLQQLKDKQGPALLDQHEKLVGYRTDPCVEDQFWLAVHVASTGDLGKTWWDFTPLRKAFRAEHGYPADRPVKDWVAAYKKS